MKLPLLDEFTFTSDTKTREVFHSFSRTTCPVCTKLVDGQRIIRDGKVYLRKQCSEHGQSEALISGDADWLAEVGSYYNLQGDRETAEELFERSFAAGKSLNNVLSAAGSYVGVPPRRR